MKKSIFLFTLLTMSYIAQAQTVLLQINPQKGQTYIMEYDIATDLTVKTLQREILSKSIIKTQIHYTVNTVRDTSFDMTAHYVNFSSVNINGEQEDIISTEGSDVKAVAARAMMGMPFYLCVDKRNGRVIKIEGQEAAYAEAEKSVAAFSKRNRTLAKNVQIIGNYRMKTCVEESFISYSEKMLKVGQTWMVEDTISHGAGRTGTRNIQYKLVGLDAEKAEITLSGLMYSHFTNMAAEAENMSVTTEIRGSVVGKSMVDVATGWVLEGSTTTIRNTKRDGRTQTHVLSTRSNQTIEFTFKRIQ